MFSAESKNYILNLPESGDPQKPGASKGSEKKLHLQLTNDNKSILASLIPK